MVGSGPNGLAAAVALAEEGITVTVLEGASTIGGGTRTSELTIPGLLHDHCSAVHPMAVASPFLRGLDLKRHGLQWLWPEIGLAHPLDDGHVAVMHHSLERTAEGLGTDGPAWRRIFGPLTEHFNAINKDLMRPIPHLPAHPWQVARFAARAAWPATAVSRAWRTPAARALFAGVSAHALRPLHTMGSASIGMMLIAAGHQWGWPVARGGSRSITDALAARLLELGGTIETGTWITSLTQLPPAALVLLDVSPGDVLSICGNRLPPTVARAYARWRHGPGAFKVDLAVEDGVPWRDEACHRSGTVHLGGTMQEIAHAEQLIAQGRMPGRPFVLVAQQYLADPERSAGTVHPVWAYAHVPSGWQGDATESVLAQIERFAPGLRDRIVDRTSRSVEQLATYNPNYVGGDILTGANTARQLLARPRFALDPYSTGIPGVFICSAAAPPGAGVHGMCGAGAAESALRYLRRR